MRAYAPLVYIKRDPDGLGARPLWSLLGMQGPWHIVEESAPRQLRLENSSRILGKVLLDYEIEEKPKGCRIRQKASFEAPTRLSRFAWRLLLPVVNHYLKRLLVRIERRGRIKSRIKSWKHAQPQNS